MHPQVQEQSRDTVEMDKLAWRNYNLYEQITMASDSRDSSKAVRGFLSRAAEGMPDLGDPLSTDRDDPLLDRERIELDDEAQ